MIVAFTGSREFDESSVVNRIAHRLLERYGDRLFVKVGDARGADRLVVLAFLNTPATVNVEFCHWPPPPSTRQQRWEAAHERNSRVVRDAQLLVAFRAPGAPTPGTNDCITQAQAAGIPIVVYHEGRWSGRHHRGGSMS